MTATLPEAQATDAPFPEQRYEPAVPLSLVHESKKNPRRHYDQHDLEQLADNMRTVGQITPVLLRPVKGGYELAAGHRRCRAAKLAGHPTVSAMVRPMTDAEFAEVLNVENLQRKDLNPIEEAEGFRGLMVDAGYDVPRIAERLGRSVQYVYDRLKLLQLVPRAYELVRDGVLTAAHGALLARLSDNDQHRALGSVSRNGSEGGVWEAERVNPEYFPENPELGLEDRRKPRTVRELRQWIDRNVRFEPEKVDQADLAFDLPETAAQLEEASTNRLKVVKITYEFRVPDAARADKERTYGNKTWKRADGEPELFNEWGSRVEKPKPSKTCDHSVVGLVVAGPGRGEAFRVCIAKEKCKVHWAKEMKAKAKRSEERAARQESRPSEVSEDNHPQQLHDEEEAFELARTRFYSELMGRVETPIKLELFIEMILRLADFTGQEKDFACALLGIEDPSTVDFSGWPGPNEDRARKALADSTDRQVNQLAVLALLSQDFYDFDPRNKRSLSARVGTLYGVDLNAVYQEAFREVKARVKAELKAAAEKAKKPKAAKKRAGDVARARKKKAARG